VIRFVSVSDVYEPIEDGSKSNLFISKSYDATSHFETVVADVKNLYRRCTGKELSVDKKLRGTIEEEQKAMAQ
jgi:Rab GDP dissociation inhibitor